MRTRAFLAVALVLTVTGCSGTPSESDGRAKLENQIQQQSNGLISLVSFSKTDGVMHEMMGIKEYEMSYSAEVEFVDNCMWRGGNSLMGWDGTFFAKPGQPAPATERLWTSFRP